MVYCRSRSVIGIFPRSTQQANSAVKAKARVSRLCHIVQYQLRQLIVSRVFPSMRESHALCEQFACYSTVTTPLG